MLQDMNRLKLGIARTSNDGHKDAQNLMTNNMQERFAQKSSESSVLLRRTSGNVIIRANDLSGIYWNKR